jgi:hypothetical protein
MWKMRVIISELKSLMIQEGLLRNGEISYENVEPVEVKRPNLYDQKRGM